MFVHCCLCISLAVLEFGVIFVFCLLNALNKHSHINSVYRLLTWQHTNNRTQFMIIYHTWSCHLIAWTWTHASIHRKSSRTVKPTKELRGCQKTTRLDLHKKFSGKAWHIHNHNYLCPGAHRSNRIINPGPSPHSRDLSTMPTLRLSPLFSAYANGLAAYLRLNGKD